MHDCIIRYCWL